jgi:site-specific recombinase XerD
MTDKSADPIEYFLEDMEQHGRSQRTIDAYRRVLGDFERYIEVTFETTPAKASYRDCTAWINTLRDDHAKSTVASYASYLNRFYVYMTQVGVLEENPVTLVIEEMDETIDANPTRRDISVPAMREFVNVIEHPLHLAVIVTLLKTGMRAGELSNLDLRDTSIEPLAHGSRPQLDEKGDSLFVSPDRSHGELSEGERRNASNKRKRSTVIPIDGELRDVLLQWLAVRPDTNSPAKPLFTHTSKKWGKRLSPDAIHHIVEKHARKNGWYRTGGSAEENVTPHYFRHFFTTHLRDRTGDRGIVKYLRGDVASDVIDTYTHNWGDRVREVYERNIYQLL